MINIVVPAAPCRVTSSHPLLAERSLDNIAPSGIIREGTVIGTRNRNRVLRRPIHISQAPGELHFRLNPPTGTQPSAAIVQRFLSIHIVLVIVYLIIDTTVN